jgi:hypothetical protein
MKHLKYLGGSFLLISSIVIVCTPLHAQVGINTKNGEPANGEAFQVKSGSASTDNGVMVKSDGNGGVQLIVGNDNPVTIPTPASASVALNAPDKAFMPNKVKLYSPVGSDSRNTINSNLVSGMVVYNDNEPTGIPPDNVDRGLYVFKLDEPNPNGESGGRWMHCEVSEDQSDVKVYDLVTPNSEDPEVVTENSGLPSPYTPRTNNNKARNEDEFRVPSVGTAVYDSINILQTCIDKPLILQARDMASAVPSPEITFNVSGAYGATINFYGKIRNFIAAPPNTPNTGFIAAYLTGAMWVAAVRKVRPGEEDKAGYGYRILDVVEFWPTAYYATKSLTSSVPYTPYSYTDATNLNVYDMSYCVNFGFSVQAGDQVSFVLLQSLDNNLNTGAHKVRWYLFDKTTFAFWKV